MRGYAANSIAVAIRDIVYFTAAINCRAFFLNAACSMQLCQHAGLLVGSPGSASSWLVLADRPQLIVTIECPAKPRPGIAKRRLEHRLRHARIRGLSSTPGFAG